MAEVIAAFASFAVLCTAWIAVGRRRSVRVIRMARKEQAA
jgi:hypothetical protein